MTLDPTPAEIEAIARSWRDHLEMEVAIAYDAGAERGEKWALPKIAPHWNDHGWNVRGNQAALNHAALAWAFEHAAPMPSARPPALRLLLREILDFVRIDPPQHAPLAWGTQMPDRIAHRDIENRPPISEASLQRRIRYHRERHHNSPKPERWWPLLIGAGAAIESNSHSCWLHVWQVFTDPRYTTLERRGVEAPALLAAVGAVAAKVIRPPLWTRDGVRQYTTWREAIEGKRHIGPGIHVLSAGSPNGDAARLQRGEDVGRYPDPVVRQIDEAFAARGGINDDLVDALRYATACPICGGLAKGAPQALTCPGCNGTGYRQAG